MERAVGGGMRLVEEQANSTRKPKVVTLSSGGKDSTLALHLAWRGGYRSEALLTMLPADPESMLYHTQNVRHVESIAECLGVQWFGVPAKKEDELGALRDALRDLGAEVFVTGGIASRYQKDRFDRVAAELKIAHYSPLWGWAPGRVLEGVLDMGLDAVFVVVAAYGLDELWLGEHLTRGRIEELVRAAEKYRFNATGEGGDFETFVLDAPLYRRRLRIAAAETRWFGDRGVLEIKELGFLEKAEAPSTGRGWDG